MHGPPLRPGVALHYETCGFHLVKVIVSLLTIYMPDRNDMRPAQAFSTAATPVNYIHLFVSRGFLLNRLKLGHRGAVRRLLGASRAVALSKRNMWGKHLAVSLSPHDPGLAGGHFVMSASENTSLGSNGCVRQVTNGRAIKMPSLKLRASHLTRVSKASA